MKIGLIDVDGHNYPNLALMKLSAYYRRSDCTVDWWNGFEHYDVVFMAKVFSPEYSQDMPEPFNADLVVKGGTGYPGTQDLPDCIEYKYPDYGLYPKFTQETAYGFLTRGCPRACPFCLVSQKEGRTSRRVADLEYFWRGQRDVVLLDPNLLACPEHEELLEQLAQSGARVDFTQGLDIRLTTPDNIQLLSKVRVKALHFAWDNPHEDLTPLFRRFMELGRVTKHRLPVVYVLTNFNTSHEEDLWRIYTLRGLGYDPYVMIYNKSTAPRQTRLLQRWCNNRRIFKAEPDFAKYNPKIG